MKMEVAGKSPRKRKKGGEVMAHGLLKCPRCKWRGNLNTNTCPKCGHLLRESVQRGKKDRSAGIRS
jgi:ssDNA-binding Zn-finger/Zn-ribbon topoisomerase 1